MDQNLINDIVVCIVAAWLLAVVAQLLKQPLVLAYLVAGFVVGPRGFAWIREDSIGTISEMGLVLLLFMIGLEIDLKKVLSAGRIITITAAMQILGSCLLGWLFFRSLVALLGGTGLDAVYLAVAAALSSTVIIVKLLYDKRELDTLAGRITLGVLVLQDLFAILFLALQPSLKEPAFSVLALSLAKVVLLMAAAFTVSRYVLPHLFTAVARLPELVLVGALAWCFLVAGLANALGLSREMGALIAGVAISTYPYTLDVTAKVTSLRDFFVTLFFVSLGMRIPAPSWALVGWSLAVSSFLVASRFITVFPTLYGLRLGHRTSALVGIHLSQLSEFSLVILALGLNAKHITGSTAGMVSYTFVLMAVLSTYATIHSHGLASWISGLLSRAGLPDLSQTGTAEDEDGSAGDIVLLGFFWSASSLLEEIGRREPGFLKRLTIIDFNPQVHAELKARGLRVIYGDIGQRETLVHAGVRQAKIIVSTLPDMVLKGTDNLRLLEQLREINPTAQIIVHAETLTEVSRLYAKGAGYVMVPRLLEAVELLTVLQAADQNRLAGKRAGVERELTGRHEVIG